MFIVYYYYKYVDIVFALRLMISMPAFFRKTSGGVSCLSSDFSAAVLAEVFMGTA